MNSILEVDSLKKVYPKFTLDDVSFSLERGTITGFIGRNGAGKSTTLKSVLDIVHPDSGSIRIFGHDFKANESEIKQKIGFVGGTVDYYKKKKIRDIVSVTKRFYSEWDDASYKKYIDLFELDEDKTPSELSEGMKVKFNLTLALSHNAELLILDEPTSGLDPVSRDELLDVFSYLGKNGITVFYSTHIISDLEKCAQYIIYIRKGKLVFNGSKADFLSTGKADGLGDSLEKIMISYEKDGFNEKLID